MMRRRLKRHLNLKEQASVANRLGWLGRHLSNENLWHVNRHTVSRAAAIGIFSAYLPIPGESVIAALLALIFRANMPISVLLIWISNPLTWMVLYGPPYLFGAWLLGYEDVRLSELTVNILMQHMGALWLGCLIAGVLLAISAYFTVQLLWKLDVVRDWERRRNRKRATYKQP